MEKESSGQFNYNGKIVCSDDLLKIRNKFQEGAQTVGFEKPKLTVLTTAAAEVLRLFYNTLDDIDTRISNIKDADSSGIALFIHGHLKNGSVKGSQNPEKIKRKLNKGLSKVGNIFSQITLNFDDEQNIVTLSLRKQVPASREKKYPKNK